MWTLQEQALHNLMKKLMNDALIHASNQQICIDDYSVLGAVGHKDVWETAPQKYFLGGDNI